MGTFYLIGSLKAVISIGNKTTSTSIELCQEPSCHGGQLRFLASVHTPCSQTLDHTHLVSKEDLLKEFPTVFDDQIRTVFVFRFLGGNWGGGGGGGGKECEGEKEVRKKD